MYALVYVLVCPVGEHCHHLVYIDRVLCILVAAVGVLGCVVLMFFINPLYAAITIG